MGEGKMAKRKCTQIVRGQHAVDGAGVRLRRVLGLRTVKDFDPFLMLDGFDSTDPKDYIKGFPWHPHRGIETVTYLLKWGYRTRRQLRQQWIHKGSPMSMDDCRIRHYSPGDAKSR